MSERSERWENIAPTTTDGKRYSEIFPAVMVSRSAAKTVTNTADLSRGGLDRGTEALSASDYNACVKFCLPALRHMGSSSVAVPVLFALLTTGCGTRSTKQSEEKQVVIWKNLGEWSGRGDAQTESFIGLTGSLRMQWRTKNEDRKGTGRFRLILRSAVSGRALQESVDETGAGEGTAYVAEDPRVFYITVESADLDWSFTVEEALFGTRTKSR